MTYHETSGSFSSAPFISAWPGAQNLIPSSYHENRQVRLVDCKPIGRLGRFHVLGKYEGGMGEVYVCLRDMEGPQPPIALKTFKPKISFDPVARRAFQRECALWARASLAPNILPVWGMEYIDGRTFIVMAGVLPGANREVTLADLIDFKPPSVALTLCFARMIAGSLALVDKYVPGLVHGDLKPSNILLMWPNLPYISDFGLARIAQQGLRGDALRPDPTYCSPNASNPSARLTVLDDVYSYGVIIGELLAEITEPRSPVDDNATSRKQAQQVHSNLLMLARECTATDPGLRPRDFSDIYARLETMVPNNDWDLPPELHRFPNPEVRPQRLRMIADTLLRLEEYNMAVEFIVCTHRDFLDWYLQTVQGLAYLGLGKSHKARRLLWKARTTRQQEKWDSNSALDLAQISYLLAGAHILVRSYRYAIKILERLINQAPDAEIRASALFSLVHIYIEKRCYKQAEQLLREKWLDKGSPDYWNQLGLINLRLRNWSQAVEAFRQALELDPLKPLLHAHLGQALMGVPSRIFEALASFNRALDCGDLNPETVAYTLACAQRIADANEIDRLHALMQRHFDPVLAADIQSKAAYFLHHLQSGKIPGLPRARSDVRWEKRHQPRSDQAT